MLFFCYLFHCVYVRAIIKCALVAVESCTQRLHIFSVNITNATKLSWIVIKICVMLFKWCTNIQITKNMYMHAAPWKHSMNVQNNNKHKEKKKVRWNISVEKCIV